MARVAHIPFSEHRTIGHFSRVDLDEKVNTETTLCNKDLEGLAPWESFLFVCGDCYLALPQDWKDDFAAWKQREGKE